MTQLLFENLLQVIILRISGKNLISTSSFPIFNWLSDGISISTFHFPISIMPRKQKSIFFSVNLFNYHLR